MIKGNIKNIIFTLKNPLDYNEYVAKCKKLSIIPRSARMYADGIGFVIMAQYKFPGMEIEEAYKEAIKSYNDEEELCDDCGKTPPGKLEQAKNLGQSIRKFVKSGFKLADNKTYEERLKKCKDCNSFHNEKCMECGCFMKGKAKILNIECPLNKW